MSELLNNEEIYTADLVDENGEKVEVVKTCGCGSLSRNSCCKSEEKSTDSCCKSEEQKSCGCGHNH